MSRAGRVVICTVAMVAVSGMGAAGVVAKPSGPGTGNAPNAKASNAKASVCKKGGWQNLVRGDGTAFASQGECVAYAAQGGRLIDAQVIAPCRDGGWENLVRSDGTAFASEEQCRAYAAQGGRLKLKPTEPTPLELCQEQLAAAGLRPADANYILGTEGNDDFTTQMTRGNDVVCGFAGNDLIGDSFFNVNAPLAAGDIFLGGEGNDYLDRIDGGTFNGGEGDDRAEVYGGTFNGGEGDDRAGVYGGTFNGGAGDDHVRDLEDGTFNGGAHNDTVLYMWGGTFNGGDEFDNVSTYCGGSLFNVERTGSCYPV